MRALSVVVGMVAVGQIWGCGGGGGGNGSPADGAAPTGDLAITAAPDGGGFVPTCAPAKGVTSSCGKSQSILRTVVKLGAGLPESKGDLVLNLNHYRLGNGATGGVAHVADGKQGVTMSPGATVQLDFDMCAGGDMWSEENCEFWLWGFLDRDGNGALDPGEPAGHLLVDVSCHADGPACFGLLLDCADGLSCVAFTDPDACVCRMPACGSSIVTCN